MDESLDIQNIAFVEAEKRNKSIIKVIGVGGGGGNAVNHMYNDGIADVAFVVVNTDAKALSSSPVPCRVQLGPGLGAGNNPIQGREIANQCMDQIKGMLDDGTKMVFITAGMGGGTGTGAAPIIAKCAKDMGILTVGIVTIPFLFERSKKINQALDGVDEMSKHVDALIVINNERLRELYPTLTLLNAFARADDTLSVAAKSISEIITVRGYVNLDFQDVKTILKDGGVALISTGFGEGEGRVKQAIDEALHSPLLNNNDVYRSKKVLLYFSFAKGEENEMTMEEMNEINEFMSKFEKNDLEFKWGMGFDDSLGKKVKITILAAGFGVNDIHEVKEKHDLESEEERVAKEQADERNRIRIEEIYGSQSGQRQRKSTHVFIFNEDEMDDENIISTVEASPAHDRTNERRNTIRKQSVPAAKPVADTAVEGNHITF